MSATQKIKAFDIEDLCVEVDAQSKALTNGTVTISISRAILPLVASLLANCAPPSESKQCSRAWVAVRALGTGLKTAINVLYGNVPLNQSPWGVYDMQDTDRCLHDPME